MITLISLLGNGNAMLARICNCTAFSKDLMQEDDHGSLPLDAQCSGSRVGVVRPNIVARQ